MQLMSIATDRVAGWSNVSARTGSCASVVPSRHRLRTKHAIGYVYDDLRNVRFQRTALVRPVL
jgi:hypothetical protein